MSGIDLNNSLKANKVNETNIIKQSQPEKTAELIKRSLSESTPAEQPQQPQGNISQDIINDVKETFARIFSKTEDERPLSTKNRAGILIENKIFGSESDRRNISDDARLYIETGKSNGFIEEVSIQNSRGGCLKGHFYKPEPQMGNEISDKVVLFLHGSGSSAENQSFSVAKKYSEEGMAMMAVSYRGFGNSDGRPSENGIYKDAKAIFDHLVNDKGIKPENIIIHGSSLSGPVAAELVKRVKAEGNEVGGVVLDKPLQGISKEEDGSGKLNKLLGVLNKSVGTSGIK